MFADPSKPHKVFPLLKAKAKETEWFCRALTFVLPQFHDQADQCLRHISRELALLRHCCKRCYVPYAPEDIDHCTEHAGALLLVLYMGRDHRRQAMERCAETSL